MHEISAACSIRGSNHNSCDFDGFEYSGKSKKAGIHCDFMKANMNAVKEGCLIDACKHSPASGRDRLDAKQIQNTRPHRH
jgi:hypothetical protein